jgi:hypothetical protein
MPKTSQFDEDSDPNPLDYVGGVDSATGRNKRWTFNALSSLIGAGDVAAQIEAQIRATSGIENSAPQVVSTAGTTVALDLSQYRVLVVSATTAAFVVTPVNLERSRACSVRLFITLSNAAHDPTLFFDVWDGSTPTPSSWATAKVHVVEGHWMPVVGLWMGRYIGAYDPQAETPTPISKPTITPKYSTSATLSSPTTLASATIAGDVELFLDPGSPLITRAEWFIDPVDAGALPADPNTSAAFVGSNTVAPFRMVGDGLWSTLTDPAENNRAGFSVDGSHQAAIRLFWVDGTSTVVTSSFTVDNNVASPTLPSAPTISAVTVPADSQLTVDWNAVDGALGYDIFWSTTNPPPADTIPATVTGTVGGGVGGSTTNVDTEVHVLVSSATPTTTITLNAGTQRMMIVSCVYHSLVGMSTMTVGGVTATAVAAGCVYDTVTDRGAWIGYILEADLPADGSKTIAVTWSGATSGTPQVHFHVWSLEGIGSPSNYVADSGFEYVDDATLIFDLPSVGANAAVFTAAHQQATTGAAQTCDLAQDATSTETSGSLGRSISEYDLDNGAAGNKTITWTSPLIAPNRHVGYALAFTYTPTTSGGGSAGDSPTIYTISGLASNTTYRIQVAAFNANGQRGSRSSVSSGTTNTVTEDIPPGADTLRPLNHGLNREYTLMSAFGGAGVNNSTFSIPRPFYGRYAARWDLAWLDGWVKDFALSSAAANWTNTVSSRRLHPDYGTGGPRAVFKLSMCPIWRTNSTGGRSGYFDVIGSQESVDTCLAMASVLGGDYDAKLQGYARNIRDFRGNGYDDWVDRVITMLGLEGNGNWTDEYSGYDTWLIGNPTLANFSNATYGSTVGAIVRSVATAGNRGLLTKAVYEHVVNVCRNVSGCSNMSFGTAYAAVWNIQNGASGTPGSNDINFTGIPDPLYFDTYGFNSYFRGNGRFVYTGSGSSLDDTDTANWASPTQDVLQSVYDNICVPRNRSICIPELGISMQRTDTSATFSGANSDPSARIAAKWMMEDFLPNVDLAFAQWWALSDGDVANYPGESHDPLRHQSAYGRYVSYLASIFPYTV